MIFGNPNPLPQNADNQWRQQIDRFVRDYQKEIAALSWGLHLEEDTADQTLGIDLEPTPHFVCCSREAIDRLNRNLDGQLREFIGVLDGHKPEIEVLLIGIAKGQIKAIQYKATPSPPECFAEVGETVDTLLDRLEEKMKEVIDICGN
ncbi:MAG TPA: hypothetical protein IGS17_08415 [Oscillatoriales cyanobacterium M59_W2019_021]|nr:MAG: hypothetical protein D6728_14335 [Cyanobacteria bacterium J055]HIK31542.1 hypothetical protein [Oscillatoriales cyanobacterium M4454_W2019_049]HIK50931.1 hypothetical protein [Oscillatoriales cyanobacterium M59_W2019_021]